MKNNNFYSKTLVEMDNRETGVLIGQKVNVSMNENEIWTLIDSCNFVLNNKDKMEHATDFKIRSLISKLVEANETLWEIKEIKTRKNSIPGNRGPVLPESKPNPILIDGEI